MINQVVINKVKIFAFSLLFFILSLILEINLIVPLLLIILAAFINTAYSNLRTKIFNSLNLSLLFVVQLTISYIVIQENWPFYYIPFCAIPLFSIILFDNLWISFALSVAGGITIGSIAGNNFFLTVLFIGSGAIVSLTAKNARRRIAVINAGLLTGYFQLILLLLFTKMKAPASLYWMLFFNGLISSILVIGLLPVFEFLFRTVTNISLLELADFHNPLLQRLIMEAPGTYHHSLIVGNLSDAACTAIGANGLLARIGAYYHDIGKLTKPEYFSENLELHESRHENLTPSMSKMIIMNHVKEGVEIAKKQRLAPSIINFVEQHHGSSLVYYFYRRALENSEINEEVEEEEFRYPGPKPDTKETAVVLLADSVEAATRTLKEPTQQKIKELVHRIINNKFIDGQLDECELTLKDMEKISACFIRILTSIYHSRITYPDTNNEQK